ncbi:MATE family efflux transporter [Romboutsia ilealis]|uniref:MATE family efflux transporter n=1 Tax=Romboutsia ilealis TaxID=1115758 RepID=UPI002573AA6B|nr:MATE family efflux transporter [Romboutsia ilealis]
MTMIIIFVFLDFLVRMFSSESDIDVINMAKKALLLYAPSYLFTWFIMTVSGFLTGLEKVTSSIMIMLVESTSL